MKRDRKAMKEALLKRTKESHERRGDSGRFKTIFRDDVKDVTYFKCVAGEHLIDILPYIAGDNNPQASAGEPAYTLEAWVHYRVGVNEDAYICLARMFNKSCPICEEQKRLKDNGEDDAAKQLNPKRRSIYNILCYDNDKEEAKGVQVWDASHHLMERLLTPLAKKPKGGGFVLFADPDDGKAISFERQGTGPTNTEYVGHKFVDRDYKITDESLDEVQCLDELIHKPTYDEVKNAFWGSKEEEEESEEAGEVEEEEEEGEEKPVKPKLSSRKATIEAKRKQRKLEKEKKEKKEGGSKCPGGGEFGVDLDTLDHCDDCKLWDDCAKKSDELEKLDDDIPF